jgi:hypothetical protein
MVHVSLDCTFFIAHAVVFKIYLIYNDYGWDHVFYPISQEYTAMVLLWTFKLQYDLQHRISRQYRHLLH